MPDLDFKLHSKQQEIFNSDAKFKVVAAGRRFGKSYYAAITLFIEGLKTHNDSGMDISTKEVWYIAPVFQQGKDIMWNVMKKMGEGVIASTLENIATIILINGRKIQIKGSDRYDSLRGPGLSYVVLDEFAAMKPEVWDVIIQPTLMESDGDALFIGSPAGKNHFYDLWLYGQTDDPDWDSFHFKSSDNPVIPKHVLEKRRATMSSTAVKQELEASFEAQGGGSFKEQYIKYADKPTAEGSRYIAVDLAGFGTGNGMVKSVVRKLDEHAIAVVHVSPDGWFVEDMIHGRWDVRETALRIVKAYRDYRPVGIGIESGALKNAIGPYLDDEMRRLRSYFTPQPLTHQKTKKTDRIIWALQGRLEKGRLILKNAPWNRDFVSQLLDFPNKFAHDDLIDSVAYIDQIAVTNYNVDVEVEEYFPLDSFIGI